MSTLHWPASGADLGVGGVSNVELLILHELWAGERRTGRPISVSVPPGPGIDIWRSCSPCLRCCAWWSGSVYAVWCWCLSLQGSSYWVGKVWAMVLPLGLVRLPRFPS